MPAMTRRDQQQAAEQPAPAWDVVDALADELAATGADLPAGLSVDERRAAILDRLRPPPAV